MMDAERRLAATLLATLPRTEVRSAEQYDDLTARRARAAGYGSLRYRLRDPARARATPPAPLSVMGNCVLGDGLEFAAVEDRLGTEVSFSGAVPMIGLSAVLGGAIHRVPSGGALATTRPGGLMLFDTDPAQRVLTEDGTTRMNLWLRAGTVVQRLEARLGHPLAAPLAFMEPRHWPPGVAATLTRLVRYVATETADPGSLFRRGIGLAAFIDMATAQLLHGVPHSHSEALLRDAGLAPVRSVRRAEAFMRANLTRPLTVDEIAQSAGCSVRALTGAFRRSKGRTLTTALREWRLDAARHELLRGDPALSIRAVAARFEFSNPGRFAAQYHTRFGEAPRRARSERE